MDAAQDEDPVYPAALGKAWQGLYAGHSGLVRVLDQITRAEERARLQATHEGLLCEAEKEHDASLLNQFMARAQLGGMTALARIERLLLAEMDKLAGVPAEVQDSAKVKWLDGGRPKKGRGK